MTEVFRLLSAVLKKLLLLFSGPFIYVSDAAIALLPLPEYKA
jgi:hypothetical protein